MATNPSRIYRDMASGKAAEQLATAAALATCAIEVRSGRGMEGLLALRQDWAAITASRADIRFHHRYEWYLSYLRHLEPDIASMHFFSFFRDGRPVGIFPLRRIRRRVAGIPLWLWELPFDPHMNLCDCVLAPHETDATLMRLLVKALEHSEHPRWDAIHFTNLVDDAFALRGLRSGAPPRTWLTRAGGSMYFACDDIHYALRNASGQFKRNLRRQCKKLDQRGRVEVSVAQERAELEEALAAFVEIEASGWKGRDGRGSAIALQPRLVRFYRELMEQFAPDQRCRINLLKLDGRPIAAQFCLIAGTTLYLLKIAYDENFHAEAPGSQLLHEVLRQCCATPATTRMSLVTSPAWAVGRWNPDAEDLWTAYVFNATPRGMAAYAAKRFGDLGVVARLRNVGAGKGENSRE